MTIKKAITRCVIDASKEYPVIAIVGPRQSGKTTLSQLTFPKHRYVSLEDFDIRAIAVKKTLKQLHLSKNTRSTSNHLQSNKKPATS